MKFIPDFPTVVTLLYILFVAVNVVIVIHDKKDPVKALAWITVIALLPVIGFVFYMVFGRNHRKAKMFNRKELRDLKQLADISERQVYEINSPLALHEPEIADNRDIITLLLNNNKAPLTAHNRVKLFYDGATTFDEIKAALRSARHHIHMEYYIIEDDNLGWEIAEILIEKAREGVEVRVIYDDVGSWGLGRKYLRALRKEGVDIHCFMKVVFPWLTSKINYRNHRKIVVVDGKVGFTGGINIADRYIHGTSLGAWRDTHMMLEGEGVAMLQSVFVTDWYFVTGKRLTPQNKYFPRTSVPEEHLLQIASSGPDSDWASIMQAFFAAITKAQHHIYISSPYFLPNEAILTAIKVAALSGVDVRILIPRKSDSKVVYWASRSYIGELMDAKVKVYLYKAGFNHSKLIMIDGVFSSVGTANMDVRSFEDNFEVTAIMYDKGITGELEESFMNDLEKSMLISQSFWESRPLSFKIYEGFSRLFSPLL